MADEFPEWSVRAAEEAAHLGELEAEFRTNNGQVVGMIALLLALLVFSFVPALIAAGLLVAFAGKPMVAVGTLTDPYWMVGLAEVLGLVLGFTTLRLVGPRWIRLVRYGFGRCVRIYSDGICFISREHILATRWSELDILRLRIEKLQTEDGQEISSEHQYTIGFPGGETELLDDTILKVADLGTVILRRATDARLPIVLKQLKNGDTVVFGRLGLSESALTVKGKTLDWGSVPRFGALNGHVEIGRRVGWSDWSIPVRDVPNVLVFLAAAERLRRAHGA